MRVSEMYRILKCDKLAMFDHLSKNQSSRRLVLSEQICEMAKLLYEKKEKEEILGVIRNNLETAYEESWFSFSWQRKSFIENDTKCFARFLNYFNGEVVEANRRVSVLDERLLTEDKELSCNVPIIAETPTGERIAYLIFFKSANKSPGGKSIHTSSVTDLYSLVTKYGLEKEMPNLEINLVFLCRDDDTIEHMAPSLQRCNSKKSNIFINKYEDWYENSMFNFELCLNMINSCLSQKMQHSCFNCDKKGDCKTPCLDSIKGFQRVAEEREYRLPTYTKEQERVVNHMDGPLVVSAPPGSGKTAVLVGRIQNLVHSGVMEENILAIGFTNEAVNELASRCSGFAKGTKFSTINALGYEILQSNEDLIGRKLELLSPSAQIELIKKLLSLQTKPMAGFKYGKEYGKSGFYKTVGTKIDQYLKLRDEDKPSFLAKGGYDTSFVELVNEYHSIVKAKGYIGFDEQVVLCNQLFQEHPEVSERYSSLYKYVMVDEFQDISKEQAEFIYAIASHRNLVVVGDDDQGIYGFRGGSNRFLLDFSKENNCETIVLSNNFRSTQEIVKASQSLIVNNESRIQKNVIAHGGHGSVPQIINGVSSAIMDNVIEHCIKEGYGYGDIAIISTKNSVLEDYKDSLNSPCVLAKSYLIHDPLFVIVKSLLSLSLDKGDGFALFQLLTVMGIACDTKEPLSFFEKKEHSPLEQKALSLINMMSQFIEAQYDASIMVQAIAYALNVDGSPSESCFLDYLETEHVVNCAQLKEKIDYMVRFEDETRVPVEQKDKVLLITSHDSKGREFPVVIMVDDYSELSEESRRLFYVAMTRAKKELYVCRNMLATQTNFANEFMNAFTM